MDDTERLLLKLFWWGLMWPAMVAVPIGIVCYKYGYKASTQEAINAGWAKWHIKDFQTGETELEWHRPAPEKP